MENFFAIKEARKSVAWILYGDEGEGVSRCSRRHAGSDSRVGSTLPATSTIKTRRYAKLADGLSVIDDVRSLTAQRDPELFRIVNNIRLLKQMIGITPEATRRAA